MEPGSLGDPAGGCVVSEALAAAGDSRRPEQNPSRILVLPCAEGVSGEPLGARELHLVQTPSAEANISRKLLACSRFSLKLFRNGNLGSAVPEERSNHSVIVNVV
ncbi:unnamed protein product [Lota lota]